MTAAEKRNKQTNFAINIMHLTNASIPNDDADEEKWDEFVSTLATMIGFLMINRIGYAISDKAELQKTSIARSEARSLGQKWRAACCLRTPPSP